MESNPFFVLGPLAVLLALLLRFTAVRFSRAETATNRLRLALAMLGMVFALHGEVLFVALDVTGTLEAFGPAMAASVFAAILAAGVMVLCSVFRKKRGLSEAQKLELNAM